MKKAWRVVASAVVVGKIERVIRVGKGGRGTDVNDD
jgi:hypothetical protein